MPDIRLQALPHSAINHDRVSYLREESIYVVSAHHEIAIST